ncbi:phospholipase [Chloroflexus sp.]|uniref:alpha/beta hydrolase n=1 Tax=Chloroflexus sp. TaxID=1904827 RepID=UPI00298F3A2B|nr:phospholipase [Chloroflexus sp.]MDW8405884.1 phospholipase [Chloroflexus sp.]
MTTIRTVERRPLVEAGPAPLLLMLHGFGSHERDLFELADLIDDRMHIVSARAPIALPWGGFAWYELSGAPGRLIPDPVGRAQAVELLIKFVSELPSRIGTDPQRTYLFGFSQGAILSLALAWRIPERLAGVIAANGYLDPALTTQPPAPGLSQLPILQLHGSYDEVIPVEQARATRDLLAQYAPRHQYHEDPVGHSLHPNGLNLMQRWLAEQLAGPPPHSAG